MTDSLGFPHPCAHLEEELSKTYLSGWDYETGRRIWTIEIGSIEELMQLVRLIGHSLIVHDRVKVPAISPEIHLPMLEIYNHW
jgi:hypothetical protein